MDVERFQIRTVWEQTLCKAVQLCQSMAVGNKVILGTAALSALCSTMFSLKAHPCQQPLNSVLLPGALQLQQAKGHDAVQPIHLSHSLLWYFEVAKPQQAFT